MECRTRVSIKSIDQNSTGNAVSTHDPIVQVLPVLKVVTKFGQDHDIDFRLRFSCSQPLFITLATIH